MTYSCVVKLFSLFALGDVVQIVVGGSSDSECS